MAYLSQSNVANGVERPNIVMEQIVIYQSRNGDASLEVRLEGDTVWLTQAQLAELFGTTAQNITMHLRNVFKEGELSPSATCKDFLQVRKEGGRTVTREQKHYNLDAIISVGYRVKSAQATQFRIWATNVLRDHLVKGYTLNRELLASSEERYSELRQAIQLVSRAADHRELSAPEAQGILKVLEYYAFALDTLDRYDHRTLQIKVNEGGPTVHLTYGEAMEAIAQWRTVQDAGALFGNEKDGSFKSSLRTIYQTFDGVDLYPSIEEKAANLLYFIVKNHSFTDGNKRIAAGIFLHFMNLNGRLVRYDGSKIIGDNALVAMTIMIAESDPTEKDTMIKLIVNLISDRKE